MTNDLYRLLKKYTGLRNLIRELKVIQSCHFFLLVIEDIIVRYIIFISVSILFPVGLREFQGVSNFPSLHYAQRHDQGHHARPWLHGGLPWSGSIARGAQINEALFHRPTEVVSSLVSPRMCNSWNRNKSVILCLPSWNCAINRQLVISKLVSFIKRCYQFYKIAFVYRTFVLNIEVFATVSVYLKMADTR